MSYVKDDWVVRSKGNRLTAAEIAFVRQCYIDKKKMRDTARELKCSSRTISKFFGYFRAEGVRQGPREHIPATPRHYTSNFEPD